jgi:dihydrodipicolinate synthase/N-acetylneuraminate lyase
VPAADQVTTDAVGEQGVFVALLTPFDAEGAVDMQALTALVVQVIDHGADGLVALGTTGEFADLDDDERDLVTRTAVAAARGRVPVVVGIGALSTDGACRNAARSESAGGDVLLALPPLFCKLDDDGLFAYFAVVAAANDLPVLSDIPILGGARLSPQLVRRIALELPQVVGVKLTVQEFAAVPAVLAAVKPKRPDFSITVGLEDLALSTVPDGGDGAISSMTNFLAPRWASWSTRRGAAIWPPPWPLTARSCGCSRSTSRRTRRCSPSSSSAPPPACPSAPPTLPIPRPCSRCATGSRACPAAAAAAIR